MQWRSDDAVVRADEHGAGRARPERVRRRRRADWPARAASTSSRSPTISTSRSAVTRSAPASSSTLAAIGTDERRNAGGTFTFAEPRRLHRRRADDVHAERRRPATSRSRRCSSGSTCRTTCACARTSRSAPACARNIQSHIGGLHLAPRGGIAWSPFKSGKTTVRAGGGIFYDWLDAQTYEQGVQLDGTHQQIETILQPGYPDPDVSADGAIALPRGPRAVRDRISKQPQLLEAIAGVEQTLPGEVRLNAMYIRRRGSNLLRGVNVNAPLANGLRPDPLSGTDHRDPVGRPRSQFDAISVNLNYMRPQQRLFLAANYTLGRSIDETDSPFGLPGRTATIWRPSADPPLNYARHRFMSIANVPLGRALPSGHVAAGAVGAALQHHDRTRRQRRHGQQRSARRRDAQQRPRPRAGGPRPASQLEHRRSAARPRRRPGPQIRILRGDNADPLGGMGGMRRPEQTLLASSSTRSRTTC